MNAPYPTPNACYTDIKQGILSYTLPLRTDLSDIPGPPISLLPTPPHSLLPNVAQDKSSSSSGQKKKRRAYVNESEEARARRLARNAERMRQKRANETEEEYRLRLAKNAESNRRKRQNETDLERTIRHARSAARERLRRAMETPEQRAVRLAKLAERMRIARANETPEQRALRLAKNAAKAKERLLNETPEQWIERKRKKAEYARQKRSAAAAAGKLGLSTTCNSSSSNASAPSAAGGSETAGFSHAPTATSTYNLEPTHSLVSLSTTDLKDIKLISAQKPGQMLQLPEQLYATPHIPFNGTDLKPPEFLTSSGQAATSGQGGPPHHIMQPELYKFHILPYTFSPTAGAVHPTQADYKGK